MLKKKRDESEELMILKALNARMELEEKDKQYYFNLLKGFEGEVIFDEYLNGIVIESFIINDLLLELNRTHFQIDSLMITQKTIYLFEVKNYEGEFYFDGEKFKTVTGKEIKNPMLQLKRNESLLRQLLNNLGYTTPIESYLIFINPEFTLYQAPLDRRIVMPTNLNRFLKMINEQGSNLTKQHTMLAEKLMSLHLTKSPFKETIEYAYSNLIKGITCNNCDSTLSDFNQLTFTCPTCGICEKIDSALIRSTNELKLLFPLQKISTNIIFDWCGETLSKRTISRILKKNLTLCGYGQWTEYK